MVQGREVWSDISKVCQMLIMTAPAPSGYGNSLFTDQKRGYPTGEGYGP